VHIYAVTGSATATSLALAIEAVPTLLVGPWAGVATDRLARRTVLVAANTAAAAGVALMLVATTSDRIGFIYAGLVLENLAVCFLRPALQAATPTLVPDESTLASANALLALSNSVWRVSGPLLGTYLAAVGWFPAVVLLDIASYLVAAALLTGLAIPDALAVVTGALAAPAVVATAGLGQGLVGFSVTVLIAAVMAAVLLPAAPARLRRELGVS
jgi:MFS family permease